MNWKMVCFGVFVVKLVYVSLKIYIGLWVYWALKIVLTVQDQTTLTVKAACTSGVQI